MKHQMQLRRAKGLSLTRIGPPDEPQGTTTEGTPRLNAAAFHPLIWQAAEDVWSDGFRSWAVRRAGVFTAAHVRDLLEKCEESDAEVIRQAFLGEDASLLQPRLRWPGPPADPKAAAMNEGLRTFAAGCLMIIRDRSQTGSEREISPEEGLERLAALSWLMRLIDECYVVTDESDWT